MAKKKAKKSSATEVKGHAEVRHEDGMIVLGFEGTELAFSDSDSALQAVEDLRVAANAFMSARASVIAEMTAAGPELDQDEVSKAASAKAQADQEAAEAAAAELEEIKEAAAEAATA
jgi:hypothetical protein